MKKIIFIFLILFSLFSFGLEIVTEGDEEILNQYTNEIVSKIQENTPFTFCDNPVTFEVKINKDGSLREYRIITSSGDKNFDNSVIEAVIKSAPFKPLPPAMQSEYLEIQYSFLYRIKRYNVRLQEK